MIDHAPARQRLTNDDSPRPVLRSARISRPGVPSVHPTRSCRRASPQRSWPWRRAALRGRHVLNRDQARLGKGHELALWSLPVHQGGLLLPLGFGVGLGLGLCHVVSFVVLFGWRGGGCRTTKPRPRYTEARLRGRRHHQARCPYSQGTSPGRRKHGGIIRVQVERQGGLNM